MGDLSDKIREAVRGAIRDKLNEVEGSTTVSAIDVPDAGVAKRVKRKKKKRRASYEAG